MKKNEKRIPRKVLSMNFDEYKDRGRLKQKMDSVKHGIIVTKVECESSNGV